MLGQKPCQRANCVSGAPCKVLNMFSEAPRRARSPSARCFVCSDSADVFWLACPCCVLCAEGTAGIVLFLFFFFVILVRVTRRSCFGASMRFPLFTVSRGTAACVCVLCMEFAYSALASYCFYALIPAQCMQMSVR